ncbi:hypothetical protein [Nonomuraea salmonea]|uniref:hypothetical protein n=1 Tax=Nonomuraea salmonea TaxID=46181 RepID=UPI0031EBFD4F
MTTPGLPYDTTEATSDHGLGLHHVQLAIPPGSEDECRRFYVDVLGMTELRKPPVLAARGGLWVRADLLEIHLGGSSRTSARPARLIPASWSRTSTAWPSGWRTTASRSPGTTTSLVTAGSTPSTTWATGWSS